MAAQVLFTFNFNNVVQGTRAIPDTAVPVGITVLSAAIARGSLDPAIVLTWNLDVSRNGGATWLPWGAAGTVGGSAFDKQGNLLTESNFTVFLDTPADAQTRLRGNLTNAGARMTTTITIRGDTTTIPVFAAPDDHHSVAYDNFKEVRGSGVTTLTTASFTIGSGTNRAALLGLILSLPTGSNFTSICGGVSGALVTNANQGTASRGATMIHGVIAPASGTQTANMAWTTALNGSLGVMTASGVDQATPTNNGLSASGTSATPTITVTTAVGDLTFACGWPENTLSAPTQTSLWLDTTVTGGGGSRGPGTGTSDVHSWSQTSGTYGLVGGNLKAAAAAPPVIAHDMTRIPKFLLRTLPRAESV